MNRTVGTNEIFYFYHLVILEAPRSSVNDRQSSAMFKTNTEIKSK